MMIIPPQMIQLNLMTQHRIISLVLPPLYKPLQDEVSCSDTGDGLSCSNTGDGLSCSDGMGMVEVSPES